MQTLFAALLGWVVGAALQLQQVALWPSSIYACFGAVAGVFIVLSAIKSVANSGVLQSAVLRQVLTLLALASLGFAATGLRATAFLQDRLDPALEGRDVRVAGVVVNLPQRTEAALRFRLQVESALLFGPTQGLGQAPGQGQAVRVPPRMDVGWYSGAFAAGPGAALGMELTAPTPTAVPAPADATPVAALNRVPPALQAGERWQMTLRLKAPHGARNPNGFDYELWLWEQGVQATGYVRAGAKDVAPQRLGSTWLVPVARVRQSVRDAILARVADRQQAGLIAALVVGDQAAIDRADWDVFRATGVAHLVSISGLHITMFAWTATLLAAWGWRRSGRLCRWMPAPSAALILGVLVAVAYSAFAGWGVPAQRTCLMLAAVALLRLSGVRWPWPWVWMLACALVVALDPWALLQPGFWLSFVAVGVLFATYLGATQAYSTRASGRFDSKNTFWSLWGRTAGSLRAEYPAGPPQGKLPLLGGSAAHSVASVGTMFREQWVVTVALAPLTLLLFGQISVVGLVANAVAIPWVTLVITPLALLGSLVPALWDVAAWAVSGLLLVLQALGAWPGATLAVAIPPLGVACLGALGALLVVAPLPPVLRVLGLPLLLPVLLWQAPRPPPGGFELLAADVGQGNAVLVRTAGHALLFDAGPRYSLESDAGHRVLVPLLQSLQERLDLVVLSHRDLDHVGGAPAVLAVQPQARLMSSIEADNALQRLRPAERCVAGQSWVWDGVTFTVLHPLASDYDTPHKPNAMSCVLRISNGQQSALLTGDIEQAQEARLVAEQARFTAGPPQGETAPLGGSAAHAVASVGAKLKSDVLLVPHHGSNTSSSAAFLDAVAPQLAIVQSGYRNRFGHPTALVMGRYAERQIKVVDSPHCGAYLWQSWVRGADSFGACWRTESERYWHHQVP